MDDKEADALRAALRAAKTPEEQDAIIDGAFPMIGDDDLSEFLASPSLVEATGIAGLREYPRVVQRVLVSVFLKSFADRHGTNRPHKGRRVLSDTRDDERTAPSE